MGRFPDPPHAYIPGQNPRHAEDHFDPIKHSVRPGMVAAELARTEALAAGMQYLAEGYYWECHEVLEAVWMETGVETPERHLVQAIIQLANARLKLLMERPRAARRLCALVFDQIAACGGQEVILGIEVSVIAEQAKVTERQVHGENGEL